MILFMMLMSAMNEYAIAASDTVNVGSFFSSCTIEITSYLSDEESSRREISMVSEFLMSKGTTVFCPDKLAIEIPNTLRVGFLAEGYIDRQKNLVTCTYVGYSTDLPWKVSCKHNLAQ